MHCEGIRQANRRAVAPFPGNRLSVSQARARRPDSDVNIGSALAAFVGAMIGAFIGLRWLAGPRQRFCDDNWEQLAGAKLVLSKGLLFLRNLSRANASA